jgi:gluconolactonase
MPTVRHYLLRLLLLSVTAAVGQPPRAYPTIGQIVRLDPRLDALLPADARIEVLATGFAWAEGPVWIPDSTGNPAGRGADGFLLFSDVPQNTIFKWTATNGVEPFLHPSGYTGLGAYSNEPGANGLALDRQGRLLLCEHGDRRVSAMPVRGGGGKVTLASHFEGHRFNSPNDLICHSDGSVYFTDPPYGLPRREADPSRETATFGVYRIGPARNGQPGGVSLLVSDLTRPNGLALSPDENVLYVGQSDESRPVLMAYPLRPDGSAGPGRVLFDGSVLNRQGLRGAFDGLKVDRAGNLWATGPGGIVILSPAGELLGRISTGEATANVGWGEDGRTLFITSDMYLCRVKTSTRGF